MSAYERAIHEGKKRSRIFCGKPGEMSRRVTFLIENCLGPFYIPIVKLYVACLWFRPPPGVGVHVSQNTRRFFGKAKDRNPLIGRIQKEFIHSLFDETKKDGDCLLVNS